MSDQFWNQLPVLITSLGALVVGVANAYNIVALKLHVNSKMDKLIDKTDELGIAKGRVEGIESERNRISNER